MKLVISNKDHSVLYSSFCLIIVILLYNLCSVYSSNIIVARWLVKMMLVHFRRQYKCQERCFLCGINSFFPTAFVRVVSIKCLLHFVSYQMKMVYGHLTLFRTQFGQQIISYLFVSTCIASTCTTKVKQLKPYRWQPVFWYIKKPSH